MSKRIYSAFSFYEFVWTLTIRLVLVVGLFYSLANYEENPILILIVSVVCLLFIFILGDDQVIVYQDRVTQTTNSFASYFLKSKDKTYEIKNIKLAYLQPLPTKINKTELAAAIAMAAILPEQITKRDKIQPIFFDLKSGETVKFDTTLGDKQMKRIVERVNSLTKKNCH